MVLEVLPELIEELEEPVAADAADEPRVLVAAALAEDEAPALAPLPSRLAKALVSGALLLPRGASEWTTLIGSRVGKMLSTRSFREVRFHWFW